MTPTATSLHPCGDDLRRYAFGAHADAKYSSYWPTNLLKAFLYRMSAAGHSVSADMMLGHRDYARTQLAKAQSSSDETLCAVAAQLHVYFDAEAPEGCKVVSNLEDALPGRLLLV